MPAKLPGNVEWLVRLNAVKPPAAGRAKESRIQTREPSFPEKIFHGAAEGRYNMFIRVNDLTLGIGHQNATGHAVG
jgi:hypothetical protein